MVPKGVLAAAILVAAAPGGGEALASTLVIGGGAAKDCSLAALAGRSDERSLATCTVALETETLDFRDRARTFVNRGVLQLRRKAFAPARQDFDAASSLDPKLGEAFVNRGAAFVGEARYREGVQQIDRGLDLGVTEPEKAWFNRGVANEALGEVTAAYRDYSRAAALNPDWPAPKEELTRFSVRQR